MGLWSLRTALLGRWGHKLQRGETLAKSCGQGRKVDSSPWEGPCTLLFLAAPLPYRGYLGSSHIQLFLA